MLHRDKLYVKISPFVTPSRRPWKLHRTQQKLMFLFPVAEVDPLQNTDTLGGFEEQELSFPFVATEENLKRV